ncbi:MAG: hypothetical protein H6842_06630 [Rhodospirillaceae bacterium]|nr:hypothetical protein [Rhodospirillaceae bacterium]
MGLKELGAAIAGHSTRVRVAFCGFDLWLEVFASGRVRLQPYKKGGTPAEDGDEGILVPMPVVGDGVVISFDPTLPPDGFRLAP